MNSNRYFISACLLGQKVRYDGKDCLVHEILSNLLPDQYVSLCPEVSGGLATPRPPAEIQHGSGSDRFHQQGRVVDALGTDVTAQFIKGANAALAFAKTHQVTHAILKAGSPSCGSDLIYDGSFTATKIQGEGITAALFRQHGIEVMTEIQFLDQLKTRQL